MVVDEAEECVVFPCYSREGMDEGGRKKKSYIKSNDYKNELCGTGFQSSLL